MESVMAKVKVLVTVDLHRADSDQRDVFDEAMDAENWKKHKNVSTTYSASFKENVTVKNAISTAKTDVEKAAPSANINSWDAVCHAGSSEPVEF